MRTIIVALTVGALLAAAPIAAAPRAHRGEPSTSPNTSSVRTLPPIIVGVRVAPHIPSPIVSRLLAEAGDIWRPNGVAFVWLFEPEDGAPDRPASDGERYPASTLRVSIGDEHGSSKNEAETPIGWIRFDGPGEPEPMIYLSYANASALLTESQAVVGRPDGMPKLERQLYMSRVLGRALAHELGHYLLASKAHTPRGLMQAGRSAGEFFGRERVHFDLDAAQKQLALSRLAETMTLTRR
jgi:hypothetical protein